MAAEPGPAPALAWSEADDDSGIMPIRAGEYSERRADARWRLRAAAPFDRDSPDRRDPHGPTSGIAAPSWWQVGTALAVLAVGAAVMIALWHTSGSAPSTPTPA